MPRKPLSPEERHARKKANALRYFYKNHEREKEKARQRYHAHIESMTVDELADFRATNNARNAQWRIDEHETYLASQRESGKRYHAKNRERLLQEMQERYKKRREEMTPEALVLFKVAQNAAQKRYYDTHQEDIAAKRKTPEARAKTAQQAKARRDADPEAAREYGRTYYAKNTAKLIAKQLAFAQKYPERINARVAQRHARIRNAPVNDVTAEQRAMVLASANGVCVYCPYYHPECPTCVKHAHKLTVDHIDPIARGGNNTLHNLVACCRSCNARKRLSPPPIPVQPLLL